MNSDSGFKYLFLVLSVFFLCLIMGATTLVFYYQPPIQIGPNSVLPFPVIFIPLVFLLTVFGLISTLVYKDAKRRGMDPWLWATVATFVPNLLGVILYLVMRQSYRRVCLNCGRGLQLDFLSCPYCGRDVQTICGQCKAAVAADWKVCPHCTAPLTGWKNPTE